MKFAVYEGKPNVNNDSSNLVHNATGEYPGPCDLLWFIIIYMCMAQARESRGPGKVSVPVVKPKCHSIHVGVGRVDFMLQSTCTCTYNCCSASCADYGVRNYMYTGKGYKGEKINASI